MVEMVVQRWIQRLLPKDPRFVELLLEQAVLASSTPVVKVENDAQAGEYLRVVKPTVAAENYLGKNCMACHQVAAGTTLGLVSMKISLDKVNADVRNFQLKVDLKNFNSDSVLVYKGRNVKMDTVLVKNGKFTYSANLDKAAGYVFLSPEAYRGSGLFVFNLPCVPGEKAEVKGDAKTRFDISGSKFYQQYHEVDVLLENANNHTISQKLIKN